VLDLEQVLRALDRQRLYLVDDLLALVVALSWVPLGVLVGEQRAGGVENRPRDVVLAGDQANLVGLAPRLRVDQLGDLRVGLRKRSVEAGSERRGRG
jgi:hypothetical protein